MWDMKILLNQVMCFIAKLQVYCYYKKNYISKISILPIRPHSTVKASKWPSEGYC